MKKILALSILTGAILLSACQHNQPQSQIFGANLPSSSISVKQALSARDDSYVTVEGSIISQIDNDEYLFGDASGQIRVEIDQHIWRGQHVTPQHKLRLYGEIDKEWNKTELKVRELTIIQ